MMSWCQIRAASIPFTLAVMAFYVVVSIASASLFQRRDPEQTSWLGRRGAMELTNALGRPDRFATSPTRQLKTRSSGRYLTTPASPSGGNRQAWGDRRTRRRTARAVRDAYLDAWHD